MTDLQIEELVTERDNLKGENTRLTAERDSLRADVVRLQESQSHFDRKLAAKLARHGIRATAIGSETPEAGKLNATQRALAAKGLPLDTPVEL